MNKAPLSIQTLEDIEKYMPMLEEGLRQPKDQLMSSAAVCPLIQALAVLAAEIRQLKKDKAQSV